MQHCRNANRQQPAWKSEIAEEKLLKKAEKTPITISLRKAYGVLHKQYDTDSQAQLEQDASQW